MKAFEEWWDNDEIVNNAFAAAAETVRFNASDDETKGYAVWRAALKWVQRTVKELDEQDAPICMGDVIKHELEDK